MHLVVFDVDGTLTRSTAIDARCFEQAVSDTLGVRIDTDWSTYRHQTDAGITAEILDRLEMDGQSAIITKVRSRFMDLLASALHDDPSTCLAVPGAQALLKELSELPDVAVAIATGAWAESARMKLNHAGISFEGIPFASSDDSPCREEIVRIVIERAARVHGPCGEAAYVGDGVWDVRAAHALGLNFVCSALKLSETPSEA